MAKLIKLKGKHINLNDVFIFDLNGVSVENLVEIFEELEVDFEEIDVSAESELYREIVIVADDPEDIYHKLKVIEEEFKELYQLK